MCPTKTLYVYGVPNSSLKDYRSPAKKNVYSFDNTPDDQFRLVDEEIPGAKSKESLNNKTG